MMPQPPIISKLKYTLVDIGVTNSIFRAIQVNSLIFANYYVQINANLDDISVLIYYHTLNKICENSICNPISRKTDCKAVYRLGIEYEPKLQTFTYINC